MVNLSVSACSMRRRTSSPATMRLDNNYNGWMDIINGWMELTTDERLRVTKNE
jgi:hypothetical protein